MVSRRATLIAIMLSPMLADAALAQPRRKVWRIGYFFLGSRESAMQTQRYTPFLEGMRGLGYVEGRDFTMDARFADGDSRRFKSMAEDLIQSAPDVIVVTGSPLYPHLKKANKSTPIVVTVSPDPVAEGIAKSLPRPGGHFTGLTTSATETGLKQVELLRAVLPNLSHYGLLSNPVGGLHGRQVQSHRVLAQRIGVGLVEAAASTPASLESAFEAMKNGRAQGLIVLGDTFFLQQRAQIAALALKHSLPTISNVREFTEAGGLLSYGLDVPHNIRRAADFVHRIIRGAKPADLPFEQPTKFELTANMRTAKLLKLEVPRQVLVLADRVIE